VTAEKLTDGAGRKPGSRVEDLPGRRPPTSGRPFETALFDVQLIPRHHRSQFEALLEKEVFKPSTAAAELGAPLGEQLQPSRIERRFGLGSHAHGSS
jgi:hypothetical protein